MDAGRPLRSLKSRALQLLAQREHSRAELRRKLAAHAGRMAREAQQLSTFDDAGAAVADSDGRGPVTPQRDADPAADQADPAAAIESLLDWLEANRYLSDARFVESRVHARIDRFGNDRIRRELAQHHAALPAQAEQSLRETEFERARAVWARRFDPADIGPASRARQSRFLAGRGFSAEVIARLMREARRACNGGQTQPEDD